MTKQINVFLIVTAALFVLSTAIVYYTTNGTVTGNATLVIDDPSSTQNLITFDFSEGTFIGSQFQKGKLVATSDKANWTSNVIDTRPQFDSGYSFWEGIQFVGSNPDITYQSRTSPDGVTFSDWSSAENISGIKTIQSPQDQYLQIKINLPNSGDSVSSMVVKYTPAFAFEIDPLYAQPSEFDYNLPMNPADRRIVSQNGEFYYNNSDGSLEQAHFYGIQLSNPQIFVHPDRSDAFCKMLKKYGFNSIKTHVRSVAPWYDHNDSISELYQDGPLGLWNAGSSLNLYEPALDRLDKLISECADEGIYTYLRIMAPRSFVEDDWDQPWPNNRPTNKYTLFFDQEEQAFQREFYNRFVTHFNPYRGMTYAEDPAVAWKEITNENSLIQGWSNGRIIGLDSGIEGYNPYPEIFSDQNDTLNQLWHDWLIAKYGNTENLRNTWGVFVPPPGATEYCGYRPDTVDTGLRDDESLELGTVARSNRNCKLWFAGDNLQRYRDEASFYIELEQDFYENEIDYLRNNLGVKGLIINSNNFYDYYIWKSFGVGDVYDAHSYWQLSLDTPQESMIKNSGGFGKSIIFYLSKLAKKEKPYTASEYNSPSFNKFASETLPVVGSYAALQGWDGIWYFSYGDNQLDEPQYQRPREVATFYDPVKATQLPIISRAYREWLSEANIMMERTMDDDRLNELSFNSCGRSLGIYETCDESSISLKDNYLFKHKFRTGSLNDANYLSPAEFLQTYGLSNNPSNQITSDTGELFIDMDKGLFYAKHQKYQGAVGVISNQIHTLPDVTIDVNAASEGSSSILLGSMDDMPLTSSEKILLSAGSRSENYGITWTHDRAHTIIGLQPFPDDYGTRPVLATSPEATITLSTTKTGLSVYALDEDGQKQQEIPSSLSNGQLSFSISPNDETLWYIIEESGTAPTASIPEIIPEPQEQIALGGSTVIDNSWEIMVATEDITSAQLLQDEILRVSNNAINLEIVPVGTSFTNKIIIANPNNHGLSLIGLTGQENIDMQNDIHGIYNQGYVLKSKHDKVMIFSNHSQGRFYGVMSLFWLLNYSNSQLSIAQLRLNDWPDLEVRGITTGASMFPTDEEDVDYYAKRKFNLWIDKPIRFIRSGYAQATIDEAISLEQYMNERHFITSLKDEPGTNDKNYQEGHFANKTKFIFENDLLVPKDNGFRVPNPSFETDADNNNIPDGWTVTENNINSAWTIDCTTSHTGSCSLKHEATNYVAGWGDKIASGLQDIKAGSMYAIRFWAKTDGQDVLLQFLLRFERNPSNIYAFGQYMNIEPADNEWHLYSARLWMPDNVERIEASIQPFNQTGGSIYIDGLEIVDLDEQLLNVVQTPATDIVITDLSETTTYTEGVDYSVTEIGNFNERHPLSGKQTTITRIPSGSIADNQEVLVSYDYLTSAQTNYLDFTIDEGPSVRSVAFDRRDRSSFGDPGTLQAWEQDYVIPTYTNLNPEFHMFWLDEIRGMNRDSRSNVENYEAVSGFVNDAYDIVKSYNPNTKILMWDDMISPFHNARYEEYQIQYNGKYGATRYASQILNKDIIPVVWWYSLPDKYKSMAESLPYLNLLGYKPMVAGYDDEDAYKWWSHMCNTNECYGMIATDWSSNGIGFDWAANYSWNAYEPDLNTCNPSHPEICDGVDNDCDANYYEEVFFNNINMTQSRETTGTEFIDEGYDLQTDEFNCGQCGNTCYYPRGKASCNAGSCQFEGCLNDYYDNNNDLSDGCEFYCEQTNNGIEIEDGYDNDCDGQIDESISYADSDLNQDGITDFLDVIEWAMNFRTTNDDIDWDERIDQCRPDGVINILDGVCVILNFDQPAFPDAEGFGMYTPGGRGGDIYIVNNLADSGVGSLRSCVEASGPRTCLFEVSGVIELDSWLLIENPYITIFGQTAPNPGITIKDDQIYIATHDVIIQHLRIRPGDEQQGILVPSYRGVGNLDAVSVGKHPVTHQASYNVILDHISASWSMDEVVSIWGEGIHDVTISNSIISEALSSSYHDEGIHSMGLLIGPSNIRRVSIINNFLAHNKNRNPRLSDGLTETLIANNFVYETEYYLAELGGYDISKPVELIVRNNEFEKKPNNIMHEFYYGGQIASVSSNSKIYSENNECLAGGDCINSTYSYLLSPTKPFTEPKFTVHDDAKGYVLSNSGAMPRDNIDSRLVNQANSLTGDFISSQDEVGGYDFSSNSHTLHLPANPRADDDDNGYTNLEDYVFTTFG